MHIRKTEDQRFNSLRSESGKVAEFKTSSSSFQSAKSFLWATVPHDSCFPSRLSPPSGCSLTGSEPPVSPLTAEPHSPTWKGDGSCKQSLTLNLKLETLKKDICYFPGIPASKHNQLMNMLPFL